MATDVSNLQSAEVKEKYPSVAEMIDKEVAAGRVLTPLGKRLLEARRAIEQSGIPLLNDEELEREKAERRGGVEYRD